VKNLDLDLMVGQNTSFHETQFTVSVDALHPDVTTGISAKDRAITIKMLVDSNTKPENLARPGHIFPLIAKDRGVLRRSGHTEAAVDFARLAGLYPSGVLVEIMNDDGTMARLPELVKLAEKFDLKIVTIKDLISFLFQSESLIERGEEVILPTQFGDFSIIPFRQKSNGAEHVALIKGKMGGERTGACSGTFLVYDRRYFWFNALRVWRPAS
jgi:3,4-dihydroxy 2-butanone 4-phosphate synthase / GTP cyclohydrolase II